MAKIKKISEKKLEELNKLKNAPKQFWVYKIINIRDGKCYYGKTSGKYPQSRFSIHKHGARNGSEDCPKLYRAIRCHGENNFIFEIVKEFDTEKEAYDFEEIIVEKTNNIKNGYNTVPGGFGSATGNKNPMFGQGHKIAGEKNGMFGKTGEQNPFFGKEHLPETLAIMSQKQASFTEEELTDIKMMMINGHSNQEIKNKYPIDDGNISSFRRGKLYKHILPDLKVPMIRRDSMSDEDALEIYKNWKNSGCKTFISFFNQYYKSDGVLILGQIRRLLNGESFRHLNLPATKTRMNKADAINIINQWINSKYKTIIDFYNNDFIEKNIITYTTVMDVLAKRTFNDLNLEIRT